MSTDESRNPEGPEGGEGRARAPGGDDPVPRLPRGRGLSLSGPEILRILMFGALLVAVVFLRQPCSSSAGKFIQAFEPPPDAGPSRLAPAADMPAGQYIRLTPDMSEDEIRQQLEQVVPGAHEAGGDDMGESRDAAPDIPEAAGREPWQAP